MVNLAFSQRQVESTVISDVTTYRPIDVHWHLGETYCLHLQVQRVSFAIILSVQNRGSTLF
jgi:hypothetical protein